MTDRVIGDTLQLVRLISGKHLESNPINQNSKTQYHHEVSVQKKHTNDV